MMTIFTKYNRQILAVMSALLLVVFLAPTAVTRCGRTDASPSTVWATTSDGASVTLKDLSDMRAQLAVLEVLRDPISTRLGVTKNADHWWLLVKEAKDAGLVGGAGDGRNFLEQAAASGGRTADDLLGQLASSSRQPAQVVLQALANLRGVERLLRATQGAPRLSAARQRMAARELLTDVSGDAVAIDAAAVGDAVPVPPPTPEQLAATFERGKSSLPGAGPAGIGYRLPDRMRIEWLVVPAGSIARSLEKDPALGPVELRKEFRRNPASFGVPAADLEPGKPAPSYEAFAPRVRSDVERRLVKERLEKLAAAVRDWDRKVMKDIPAEGGFAKLPEDWATRRPGLDQLGAELASRFGVDAPIAGSSGDAWFTVADVDANPFLGKATSSDFGQPQRVSDLVRSLREFQADGRFPVQAGTVGPVATTPTDDLVVWRVTAADPSHDPAGMAEVIDAVTRDATAQARYDALAAKVADIEAEARGGGLDALASKYGTSVLPAAGVHLADAAVLRQYRIRFPGGLPKVGQDTDAIRAVVSKAVSLPGDLPVSAVPEADRTLAVAVPSKLTVLAFRINGVRPLSIEEFREIEASGALVTAILQDEPSIDLVASFGQEAMAKRNGYQLKNPDGPDRPVAPQAPAF